MGRWMHRLSNKDLESKMADCAMCGRVPIRKKGKVWRCYIGHHYGSQIKIARDKPIVATCEICGQTKKMSFDHDHSSGQHRGWLCHTCNVMIGMAKNNPETLKRAAEYLLR